ncbi:MAG TPA: hypothetical protein VIY08_09745 [Candidatus Nitrosocosmicus sp.]
MSVKKVIPNSKDKLCELIFNFDDGIRFVGIVNQNSEVIEGGFKKGVEPLLDMAEEQDMYLQSISNMTFFQSFSSKFGPVDYLVTKQKKITMITFPYNKNILCLSVSSFANIDKIRDMVLDSLSA